MRICRVVMFISAQSACELDNCISESKRTCYKIFAIDDTDPTSHLSMAMVKMFFDWIGLVRRNLFKALEVKPNFSKAYHYYAIYLTVMNRYQDALKTIQKDWK
jgi:hypothetical protein